MRIPLSMSMKTISASYMLERNSKNRINALKRLGSPSNGETMNAVLLRFPTLRGFICFRAQICEHADLLVAQIPLKFS